MAMKPKREMKNKQLKQSVQLGPPTDLDHRSLFGLLSGRTELFSVQFPYFPSRQLLTFPFLGNTI